MGFKLSHLDLLWAKTLKISTDVKIHVSPITQSRDLRMAVLYI